MDEHKVILEEKQKNLCHKIKLQDEQLKSKVVEVEKKEAVIVHMEEKVNKRGQAIEKKLEKWMKEKSLLNLMRRAWTKILNRCILKRNTCLMSRLILGTSGLIEKQQLKLKEKNELR